MSDEPFTQKFPEDPVSDRYAFPSLSFRYPRKRNEAHVFQYEKHMTYRGNHHKACAPPDPTIESLDECLHRLGYRDRDIEGHCNAHQQAYFAKLLTDNPWIQTVVEVGFNAGHSADTFLRHPSRVSLTSFDILLHGYARHSKVYIDKKFPGRHTLVAGDSVHTVPAFAAAHPGFKADLIFVDGDHRYEAALFDIFSCGAFAHDRTLLVVDNVAPHRGMGREVYFAWRQLLHRGVVSHFDHVETDGYRDAWTIGRYAVPRRARATIAGAAAPAETEAGSPGAARAEGAAAVGADAPAAGPAEDDHAAAEPATPAWLAALPPAAGDAVAPKAWGETKDPTLPATLAEAAFTPARPDYAVMERRVEVCELGRRLDAAETEGDVLAVKARVEALHALDEDRVDAWGLRMCDKKLDRLRSGGEPRGGRGRGRGRGRGGWRGGGGRGRGGGGDGHAWDRRRSRGAEDTGDGERKRSRA